MRCRECSFHHCSTGMWHCEEACSSAASVYFRGSPELYHQSRAFVELLREAASMASDEYSLVRKVGDVRQ